jgi:hypothetical protein
MALPKQAMIASQQPRPRKAVQRLPRWIQHPQLDNRALALFRIGLGLLGLINAILPATAVKFPPATGSIDLSEVINRQAHGAWSLHWPVGDSLNAQLALLLLFTLFLHNSNPLIINAGDLQLATALL